MDQTLQPAHLLYVRFSSYNESVTFGITYSLVYIMSKRPTEENVVLYGCTDRGRPGPLGTPQGGTHLQILILISPLKVFAQL